jgi:hypothetical protein
MEQVHRHHCLVYEGSPSRHLPVLAAALCEKLDQNYRCFYLNNPEMVAEMRACLEARGLDVEDELRLGTLFLSSDRHHLKNGQFDTDAMLRDLGSAVRQALTDGFSGLWASGDMAWEFGPERDFSQLLDYEWKLEQFMQKTPEFTGVCQYHAHTLPRQTMRQGLLAHPSIFINESVALVNPHFLHQHAFTPQAEKSLEVESALDRLLQLEFSI